MQSIVGVKPVGEFRLQITFKNRKRKVVDIAPFLRGPVFEFLKNRKEFRKVRVNREFGCIEWPNGADISPDVLYYGGLPPWARRRLSVRRPHA